LATRKLKSFGTPKEGESLEAIEPIAFELAGEEFEAYGEVSGAVLLDFVSHYGSDNGSDTAKAILDYLKDSMDAENYKRFQAIIRDPKKLIKLETLSEIVGYLMEERSSRPSKAS
jgi:hypothetical protein